MKLCIFGQGTGGNAALWFEYFNKEYNSAANPDGSLSLVVRTVCTLPSDFDVVAPYGKGAIPKFVYKFYAPFVAKIGLPLLFKYYSIRNKFDCLLLQGNYTPTTNLMIVKKLRVPFIINIYGSDFYRKYLLNEFTKQEKLDFIEVLDKAGYIILNWQTSLNDFVKEFPQYKNKCLAKPWGVSEKWVKPVKALEGWPEAEKVFLSARGLYDYNNIDIVVEAFCRAFKDKPKYKLFIVNGYGNHQMVIRKVKNIIKEYNAEEQVILKIEEWISDEELMALYNRADYNFCFGSTDQLTVSIVYAIITKGINILSPLDNYVELQSQGYMAPVIVPKLNAKELERVLIDEPTVDDSILQADAKKAIKQFNMDETFTLYRNSFDKLLRK